MKIFFLGSGLIQKYGYYAWNESVAEVGVGIVGQGGRLKSTQVSNLQNLTYVYDAVGNIRTITDSLSSETQSFSYDALDRLVSFSMNGLNPESYGYNAATGNLETKGSLNLEYTDQAHVHAVKKAGNNSYDYDANGNQIRRVIDQQTYTLGYDAENRLVHVTGPSLDATFTYDGDGKRVKCVINRNGQVETKRFVNAVYESDGDPDSVDTTVNFTTNTSPLPNDAFSVGRDENWKLSEASDFPATSIFWSTSNTATSSHSGPSAYSFSNQSYGQIISDAVTVTPGSQYNVSAWVRGQINPDDVLGGWLIRVYFYDATGNQIAYENVGKGTSLTTTWTQKSTTTPITAPANSATLKVWLYHYLSSGWVAYDDVSVIKVGTSTNLIANPGFETTAGWTTQKMAEFPATGFWRNTWGTAAPHGGSYAYVISNQMYGQLSSTSVSAQAGSQYDISAWVHGNIDADDVMAGWLVRVHFYDTNGTLLSTQTIDSGTSLSTSWTKISKRITAPANAATQRFYFYSYLDSGWFAFDDASIIKVGTTTNLLTNPGFETATGWTESTPSGFPGTSYWRATWGTAAPHSGSYAYSISNQAYGNISQAGVPFTVVPGANYDVSTWIRGKMDSTTFSGWLVQAKFYDASDQYLSTSSILNSSDPNSISTTWALETARITVPAEATKMVIYMHFYLASGWVAYDDPSVVKVGTTTNLVPNPDFETITYKQSLSNSIPVGAKKAYSLSALVRANTGDAIGDWAVRLHYYDAAGQPLPEPNDEDIISSPNSTLTSTGRTIGGQFTTPDTAASMKISLSSALTAGTLTIENVSLFLAPDATKYYFAGAQRIAMRTYQDGVYTDPLFFSSDHLGSTSLTTDAAGNEVSELHYKPWGEVRDTWKNQNLPNTPAYALPMYTFTGQFSDSYINLLWYGSRHYDPELGRFISPDSIVPTSTQGVQAWDRYAYTNNNPLRYTDPTGHCIGLLNCVREAVNATMFLGMRAWEKGGINHLTNSDFENAANYAAPAVASGSKGSVSVFMSEIVTGVGGVSLVTTADGQSQVFNETGIGAALPGVGASATIGDVHGLDYVDPKTGETRYDPVRYRDGATQGNISIPLPFCDGFCGPYAEGYISDDHKVWGTDVGLEAGFSPTILGTAHTNATPADTVLWIIPVNFLNRTGENRLEGPGLLGCRLLSMCGAR